MRSSEPGGDAEVEDLGRRLLAGPHFVRTAVGAPGPTWTAWPTAAWPKSPDDPDDPARLVNRLEATADGCRWLLDRWAELRKVADAGTAWPAEQMVHAIRLLGKRPFDAVDDFQVLTIIVACYVMDRSRPDPFAELWKTTTDREAIYYRQRLLGRRLLEAKPRSKEHAREVLLEIVDQAVSRLEEEERQHRRREREAGGGRVCPMQRLAVRRQRGGGVGTPRAGEGHAVDPADHRAVPQGAEAGRDAERGPSPAAATRAGADPSAGGASRGRPAATDGRSVREAGPAGPDPAGPDLRRPEPTPAEGVHRRPGGGSSQGDQEPEEAQAEALQPGEGGADRDPSDQVAGGPGAGGADHRLARDDCRGAVIGSARAFPAPGALGHPRRTRSSLAGSSPSGIAFPPPKPGLRPPKKAKRSQRWVDYAGFAGPAAARRVPVRSVARPSWRERRPLIGRSTPQSTAPVRRGCPTKGNKRARRYLLIHDRRHVGTSLHPRAPDRSKGT